VHATLREPAGSVKPSWRLIAIASSGSTAFRCPVRGILAAVQICDDRRLPYTALRDAVLTHPTLVEGLIPLLSSAASAHNVVETREPRSPPHEVNCNSNEKIELVIRSLRNMF